ncbi:hypothetical protein [Halalkalibacterium ligniniphilum]|uniref:hypothetical protein n=1 Tax=Halalkalibacterium ligniniphilum TaxID=1134413 RepID=UPI000344EEAB|nr:hypothetical protein [Halalkalibacterium ligniniphilum]
MKERLFECFFVNEKSSGWIKKYHCWSHALLSILVILMASLIIGRYKKSPIQEKTVEEEFEISSVQARTSND